MLAERFTPLRAALALLLGLAGAVTGVAIAAPAATSVGPDGTVALTVVVPLAVPESDAGFIPADALDQYTRPTGLLTRELDAIIDRPVVIAIDPRIIASIRILGSSAPASAIEWLSRLESASNETFALTYADSDITLGLQAGSPRVLQPESFDFAIDPSLFAEAAAQTPAPTPSPDATAPGMPTSESLLAWPYTLESIAWPRDGTVVTADLSAITASGYTTTILSSANVSRDEGSALVRVDGGTAAISDDAVSGALRTAVASVSPEDWVSAMATVGSALDAAPATVLATLDRTVPITGTHLAETLSTLQADPRVRLTGLSQLLAGSADEATLVDSPQPAASVGRMAMLLDAESAEIRFATVAESPSAITSPRRLHLLALLSSAWLRNPEGWLTATDAFLTDSDDLRASVQVVAYSSFNLLADSASLPISVSNSLDQAVTVYITVRPETALLAVTDSRVELVVEPDSQAKGQIPVQAVSNGTVQVLITLASGAGVPIGAPATAEINVQAGWETPIVLVVGIIVVLVFGGGIVRNILRRRKPARPVEPTDD